MTTGASRFTVLTACAALLVSNIGCATVAHGRRENVTLTSSPPGATIFVNDTSSGARTPSTLSLPRRRAITLRFERDGYAPREMKLQRHGSKWLWLDLAVCSNPLAGQGLDSLSLWPLLILGCFAELSTIDLLSGAAFALPKRVQVELVPISGSP
ncbi:MAG: PEGA domain-containing protein [Vicinamibacterales bacterium]